MEQNNNNELLQRLKELEKENRKLKKINLALMERVESTPGNNNQSYTAFEHSALLAEQVRERTEALHRALDELKASNQALEQAKQVAETTHQRLLDAIESISDAFVLFDKSGHVVLSNSKYRALWEGTGVSIEVGSSIDDITRLAFECGLISEADTDEASAGAKGGFQSGGLYRLRDGQWVQINDRRTATGDLVVLLTDVTLLKEIETARRERALAQKSRVLQNTLENLSQGVVLVNREGNVEIWNSRFLELTGLSEWEMESGRCFQVLIGHSEIAHQTRCCLKDGASSDSRAYEVTRQDGSVLEIRNHPISDGGYVVTYTDITERSRYENALRESEQKIRLVTDALPALISYANDKLCLEFTNKAYQQWHGLSEEEMNGKPIAELYTPQQLARLQKYIDQVMAGKTVEFEIEETNARGESRYLHRSYVPNLDAEGYSHGFFVLSQDVTERRKTAEALQNAYQHLEQRVRERTQKLTELNQQLRQEITERKAIEARLIEAKKAAEHANVTKTKFLAAVSHDLLQPMNAARLFTAALTEQTLHEEARSLVDSVNYSLEDVESLLGSLVDISKLDAGVVVPQRTAFRANDLLLNLANEYRQVAEAQQLQLHFVPSSCVIYTDSQLLGRILRNFLSNAMRYTDPGGCILFGCRRKQGTLVIEVWDTGMGIPEEKLTDIFLEFNRIKRDGSGKDQGLGLGLAIVDKVSRVLGHQIYVHSQLGKGSVFSVEVPYGRLEQAPAAISADSGSVHDVLQGLRVLVIDNDASICQGMATLLGKWGCEVLTCLSLPECLDKSNIMQEGVDLIIADYHLDEDENGLDAADTINGKLPARVPVLMITANHSPELAKQIKQQGHQILYKPVKPLKLKTTLHYMLQC